MYEVCLLWDNHAMRKSKQGTGKGHVRERNSWLVPICFISSEIIQMRCQTCDCKKPSLGYPAQFSLQMTPAPTSIWLQFAEKTPVTTAQLSVLLTVKIIINCYFKPLKLEAGDLLHSNGESNQPLCGSCFVLSGMSPQSPTLSMYHSYLRLSKNLSA